MNVKKWIRFAAILCLIAALIIPVHTQLITTTKAAGSISLTPAWLTSGEMGPITATAGGGLTFDNQTVVLVVKNGQTIAQAIQAAVNPANPTVMTFKVPPLQQGDYQVRFIKQGVIYETNFSVVAQASPAIQLYENGQPFTSAVVGYSPKTLSIIGTNTDFLSDYNLTLTRSGASFTDKLTDIKVESAKLTFTLQSGLTAGTYTLQVVNKGVLMEKQITVKSPYSDLNVSAPKTSLQVNDEVQMKVTSQNTLLGTEEDLTQSSLIAYESLNPDILSVSSTGKVKALQSSNGQNATIKVKLSDGSVSYEKNVAFIVHGAAATASPVVTIEVRPAEDTITINSQLYLQAIATHDDNTTSDVSKQVKWESSNPNFADIDQNGIVSAKIPGQTIIKATLGDKIGTKNIRVVTSKETQTQTEISSIILSSPRSSLHVNEQVQLQVTALPSHDDVTASSAIIYESGNPDVLSVSASGLVTVLKNTPGTYSIKAVYRNNNQNLESWLMLSVRSEATPIIKVEVKSLENKYSVHKGSQLQFQAVATYADGTSADITNSASWSSSNSSVAEMISNGNVLGRTEGQATISVSSGQFSDSKVIQVTAAAAGPQNIIPVFGQPGPVQPPLNTLLNVTRPPVVESPDSSISLKAELRQNGDKATANVDTTAALESILKSGKNEFNIHVPGLFNKVEANVSSEVLKSISEKSGGSLKIQSDRARFIIPAQALMTQIENAFGAAANHAQINVTMDAADNLTEAKAQSDAMKTQSRMVVQPVDFKIEVKSGDRSVSITDFQNVFITRSFDLQPNLVNPNKATAVIYLPDTRSYRHVPTFFTLSQDGKMKANFKRNGNSIYTVLETDAQFKDVTGSHWAQKDIELMASKLILLGTDTGEFYPDNQVTRAEFAAIIVRALGLLPEAPTGQFKDVDPKAWYAGEVQAAFRANIVSGRTNEQFDPGAPILRQEMAQMIVNSLQFAGKSPSGNLSNTEMILSKFRDNAQISTYARPSVAFAAEQSIVSGMTADTFEPLGLATRAQAATMVIKMLRALDFVN